MKRPLLVSDLDGTLLNSAKAVSERTASTINRFVAEGGLFTIATARMAYGCDRLVAGLDLRVPGVVMNGAALYSFAERAYQQIQPLPAAAAAVVAEAVARADTGAFVYAVADGELRLGHVREIDLEWTQYNSERARQSLLPFSLLGLHDWDSLGEIVYVAVVGSDLQLAQVAAATRGVRGLAAHPYRNVYTERDCLEFSSSEAGKEAAVLRLRELAGADGLVVFGDTHNDLGMMQLADLSLAPSNSVPAALAVADEVIGSNDADGVAGALELHWREWLPPAQVTD